MIQQEVDPVGIFSKGISKPLNEKSWKVPSWDERNAIARGTVRYAYTTENEFLKTQEDEAE